jgi:hypothetical protein
MNKKVVGIIKLAPYVPAWYDAVNNIHLVRPHCTFKEVHEGMDLSPIMNGVHAGYLIFKEATEEAKQKVKESKPKKAEVSMKVDDNVPLPIKKRRSKKAEEPAKVEEAKEEVKAEEKAEEPIKEDK